ncbi:hypothetical protein Agub_g5724 [Astrephomene gubernaculifera]|uniref:Magnesium transporter MgtE intracellular domain-containing protein n=1 Tax=Astrephomene gubernaculifera TaxID=47775 RepID=A0AAD3HKW0_9CHLO|nr:hypothetical protein Agub_g5724 [Astrephomene gubernaculifera]
METLLPSLPIMVKQETGAELQLDPASGLGVASAARQQLRRGTGVAVSALGRSGQQQQNPPQHRTSQAAGPLLSLRGNGLAGAAAAAGGGGGSGSGEGGGRGVVIGPRGAVPSLDRMGLLAAAGGFLGLAAEGGGGGRGAAPVQVEGLLGGAPDGNSGGGGSLPGLGSGDVSIIAGSARALHLDTTSYSLQLPQGKQGRQLTVAGGGSGSGGGGGGAAAEGQGYGLADSAGRGGNDADNNMDRTKNNNGSAGGSGSGGVCIGGGAPSAIARLLSQLPIGQQLDFLQQLPHEEMAELLPQLPLSQQVELLKELQNERRARTAVAAAVAVAAAQQDLQQQEQQQQQQQQQRLRQTLDLQQQSQMLQLPTSATQQQLLLQQQQRLLVMKGGDGLGDAGNRDSTGQGSSGGGVGISLALDLGQGQGLGSGGSGTAAVLSRLAGLASGAAPPRGHSTLASLVVSQQLQQQQQQQQLTRMQRQPQQQAGKPEQASPALSSMQQQQPTTQPPPQRQLQLSQQLSLQQQQQQQQGSNQMSWLPPSLLSLPQQGHQQLQQRLQQLQQQQQQQLAEDEPAASSAVGVGPLNLTSLVQAGVSTRLQRLPDGTTQVVLELPGPPAAAAAAAGTAAATDAAMTSSAAPQASVASLVRLQQQLLLQEQRSQTAPLGTGPGGGGAPVGAGDAAAAVGAPASDGCTGLLLPPVNGTVLRTLTRGSAGAGAGSGAAAQGPTRSGTALGAAADGRGNGGGGAQAAAAPAAPSSSSAAVTGGGGNGGSSAGLLEYRCEEALERLSVKLHGVRPEQLAPDVAKRMRAWLQGMDAVTLQGTLRSGCVNLVLDVSRNLRSTSSSSEWLGSSLVRPIKRPTAHASSRSAPEGRRHGSGCCAGQVVAPEEGSAKAVAAAAAEEWAHAAVAAAAAAREPEQLPGAAVGAESAAATEAEALPTSEGMSKGAHADMDAVGAARVASDLDANAGDDADRMAAAAVAAALGIEVGPGSGADCAAVAAAAAARGVRVMVQVGCRVVYPPAGQQQAGQRHSRQRLPEVHELAPLAVVRGEPAVLHMSGRALADPAARLHARLNGRRVHVLVQSEHELAQATHGSVHQGQDAHAMALVCAEASTPAGNSSSSCRCFIGSNSSCQDGCRGCQDTGVSIASGNSDGTGCCEHMDDHKDGPALPSQPASPPPAAAAAADQEEEEEQQRQEEEEEPSSPVFVFLEESPPEVGLAVLEWEGGDGSGVLGAWWPLLVAPCGQVAAEVNALAAEEGKEKGAEEEEEGLLGEQEEGGAGEAPWLHALLTDLGLVLDAVYNNTPPANPGPPNAASNTEASGLEPDVLASLTRRAERLLPFCLARSMPRTAAAVARFLTVVAQLPLPEPHAAALQRLLQQQQQQPPQTQQQPPRQLHTEPTQPHPFPCLQAPLLLSRLHDSSGSRDDDGRCSHDAALTGTELLQERQSQQPQQGHPVFQQEALLSAPSPPSSPAAASSPWWRPPPLLVPGSPPCSDVWGAVAFEDTACGSCSSTSSWSWLQESVPSMDGGSCRSSSRSGRSSCCGASDAAAEGAEAGGIGCARVDPPRDAVVSARGGVALADSSWCC